MDWNEFVKEAEKYGYKEYTHIGGSQAVWKRVTKGKYANGKDIFVFSPAFSKDGKIFFTDVSYKENMSYEKMLKIIDAIESEE